MHFDQLRRRAFITLLGGVAAWPVATRAQQPDRMRQIGVLMGWPESDPEARLERAAFVQELQKLGWLDGRNLRIDTRWANPADPESMHRYAKELVALQPDLGFHLTDGRLRKIRSTYRSRRCAMTRISHS